MTFLYDSLPLRAAVDGRRVRVEVLFSEQWVEVARLKPARAEELAQLFDEVADEAYIDGAAATRVAAATRFVRELDAAITAVENGNRHRAGE